ncbi:MAG TPA: hypothetical protein DEF36_00045 [Desulfotomaculum sp.]|nr:hypothetical protein [Desulfotomaculum sp.]
MKNGSGMIYARVRYAISVLVLSLMVALSVYTPAKNPGGAVEEGGTLYGEYIGWAEVNRIFPRKGTARIIDLDTGRSFQVMRVGGSYHADTEPLSYLDSVEMNSIFGGSWSWKRRAALLTLDGKRFLACSINGMPHGSQQIKDNNYPGHFCIHFRDSRLHVNRREDPAHMLMVCKAAGMLDEMLAESSPGEVVKTFFTALDQGELGILARVTYFETPDQLTELLQMAQNVDRANLHRASGKEDTVTVELGLKLKNSAKSFERAGSVKVCHSSYLGWRVDYSSVKPLLLPGKDDLPAARITPEDTEEDLTI